MRSRLLWTVVGILLAACGGGDGDGNGGGGTKPVAGELTFTLSTPFVGMDGALLVRVVGQIDTITVLGGHRLSFSRGGNLTRAVVAGNIEAGDLIRIRVPDVSLASSYSAFVEQAAARGTYVLLDPSEYRLTLRTP